MTRKTLLGWFIMCSIIVALFYFIPSCDAHILVIGDSQSDIPSALQNAKSCALELKSKGYNVLELYQSDATAKNILKGMYNADAVIYAGHGGYQSGNYANGGSAKPPLALVGSDEFIWGIGDKMREGWNSPLFKAPFKKNIPVILIGACFSTGWVNNQELANPIETVYNFSRMFTGSGANYYATAYDREIITHFLNGAANFKEADQKNWESISQSTTYNGVQIWRNNHGHTAFVGNWYAKFPTASQTTPYDNVAAELWYKSNRQGMADLVAATVIAPLRGGIGNTISITNKVMNHGLKDITQPFYVSFWLTPKQSSNGTIYLGKRSISSLARSQSNSQETQLKIPSKLSTGSYYIRMQADSSKSVPESNENNNFKYSSTKISIGKASKDLSVTQITMPSTVKEVGQIYVTNTVKNNGYSYTCGFYTSFYLTPYQSLGSKIYLGKRYIPSLAPGTTNTKKTALNIPKNHKGTYYIAAVSDATNVVAESNEKNNAGYSTCRVKII